MMLLMVLVGTLQIAVSPDAGAKLLQSASAGDATVEAQSIAIRRRFEERRA
ncbi:hypothetical protein [Sphingomonas quercus]|uniref:Uncharacterized protein n=1 Tax=Sphingomonas quercus TaxID=2842451 RepID=A0ABS6BMK7_9SPHN|nr:hypothetical protein [Sphingomonas quercus]MBU3079533.1 hypothetical protein [Sphingomonas quercus]